MSFLHGVLDNIQPKLGQHKDTLGSALTSLKSTKLNGITKYKAAVAAVADGVRAYNERVERSNSMVSTPMNVLIRYVRNRGELLGSINRFQVTDDMKEDVLEAAEKMINEQLDECKKNAAKFNDTLDTETQMEIRNIISELNPTLSLNVKSALKAVKHETKRLSELSEKEKKDLKAMTDKINTVLESVKEYVNCKIDEKIKALAAELKKKVEDIWYQLKGINTLLIKYVKDFEKWMNKTKEFIEKNAQSNVQKVLDEVDWTKSSSTSGNWKNAEDEIQKVGSELSKKVSELGTWNAAAGKVVEAANKQCDAILERVHKDSGVKETEIGKAAEKLRADAAKLFKDMTAAHTHISGRVTAATQALEKVKKAVMEDLKALREAIKETVRQYFMELAGAKWEEAAKNGGDVTGLKSAQLQAWISAAKEALKGANGAAKGFTGTWITNYSAFKNMMEVLGGLRTSLNISSSDAPESAFGAMSSDAQGKIVEMYGAKGGDVAGSGITNPTKNYEGGEGIQLITGPLGQINTQEGLQKLDGKDHKGNKIEGNTFPTLFSTVETQLEQIAGMVEHEKKKQKSSKPDGVKDYLNELNSMITKSQEHQLTTQLNPPPESTTVQGLAKIQTEIEGLRESSVRDLTSNVDKLCSAIRQAAQDVKGNSDILKEDNIEKKLEAIRKNISDLQIGNLTKAIEATKTLLTLELGLFSSRCIASLEGDVRQQIDDAKKQLTTQAKKLYVTSVRDMLLAFASKVSEELHELPKQITEDADKGVRGFMKKMEERFIKTAKRIANVSPTQSPAALPNPGSPEKSKNKPKSPLSQAAMTLNTAFRLFFDDLQNQPDFKSDYDKVAPSKEALTASLNGLVGSLRFNHDFSVNIELLSKSLSGLNPESHGECECPLLINALRAGFPALVAELDKAYMNKYDGASKDFKWEEGDKLTDEATKCAKLFLTTLPVLNNNLNKLTRKCHVDSRRNWRESQINLRVDNPLGKFLAGQGYAVSSDYESQDGELQNNDAMRGQKIYELLVGSADKHVYTTLDDKADEGALNKFCNCLLDFYKASHLKHINAPTYPTTISHMLEWLCGLTHHPVYQSLSLGGFADLFEKPKEQDTDNAPLVVSFNDDPDSLDAYPRKITATGLSQTLVEVCHLAEDTLIAIVGHGHADGVYACDYNTNRHGLSYPTNMNTLICTLFDILQRLHCQLYFLYNQCYYGDMYNGWRECYYGNGVGGSSWKCNDKLCANQTCNLSPNQRADQSGNLSANLTPNQICEQHPKCGVKSPLQSFLEDGLQGFLPHTVSSRGSSLSCSSCSKLSPGVPCRTPMGFVDISTLASHTSTGERIIRALLRFCGINSSPLSNLCALLNCVLPRPPQSLGAMFAFYYNFIAHWGQPGNAVLTNAVSGANFKRNDATLDIAPLFKSSDHTSEEEMTHRTGDLYTLVNCKSDSSSPTLPCGPYLRPHSRDICSTFAEKNADKYLSWIVYLTQTFYDLLKTLYKECCEMCDKRGTTCYQKCCDKKCEVIYPDESKKHTGEYEKEVAKYWTARHNSECKSIFKCSHTIKIFSKYGFYFGSPSKMSGSEHVNSKRTCRDFCKALATVLNDVEADEAPLAKLIYHTSPIHIPLTSPLVAVAPVPAAHRRRPPRRAEDTLTPEIALKPPHRRAVPPRRRTRQGTRQRQVLLTVIVPSRVICVSPTQSTTHSPTHPLNQLLTHPPTHSTTQPLNHSPTQPLTQPPTQPLNYPLNHPLIYSPPPSLVASLPPPSPPYSPPPSASFAQILIFHLPPPPPKSPYLNPSPPSSSSFPPSPPSPCPPTSLAASLT
ncbi:hypothetical protein, conserved [Babesia ovata]|uniref:Extracellular matrix-binding ebh n=1 Tax=Babesia ovata TaxID=189622 RepID=A0A2H6KJK0_9APIC|nr:uncharacterized protein BOVATA_046650 [Babesia ovata]GBE63172.1 hypothetical protein, conserved [Babesia ovata]